MRPLAHKRARAHTQAKKQTTTYFMKDICQKSFQIIREIFSKYKMTYLKLVHSTVILIIWNFLPQSWLPGI